MLALLKAISKSNHLPIHHAHNSRPNLEPAMLFSPPGFARYDYNTILEQAQTISSLHHIIILSDIFHKHNLTSPIQHHPYEPFLSSRATTPFIPDPTISCHSMINIQFTSGSTGLPKSVSLSHYNIMNCGRNIHLQTRMTPSDRICCPVPLFHSFGMIVAISTTTVCGSSLVFPSELYDPSATLHCIERYKCTALYGVTTMFIAEMTAPTFARTDKSSLKFGIVAGSAMPPEFLRRVMQQFEIPRIYSCWGMTELSSFVTMMHETDPWEKRIHTTGRLFPNFVLKIVKPGGGAAVPWGGKGEIVVSGYGVMAEYVGNQEKTEEALRVHEEDLGEGGVGPLRGGEGKQLRKWMHTGDEGMLDGDGYLVFTGRIKDLIIRGGENIAPLEIEERLSEMRGIAQASVVGVPDEKYGEAVGVFLEGAEGSEKVGDEEVRKWVREKLAYFKAPQWIWWLGSGEGIPEEWPKTMSGKISKPELREIVKGLVGGEKKSKAKL